MQNLIDRRTIKNPVIEDTIARIEEMYSEAGKVYGLSETNRPTVIAIEERAKPIEDCAMCLAWGRNLESWKEAVPGEWNQKLVAKKTGTGGFLITDKHETDDRAAREIRSVALLIGQYREIKESGSDPENKPWWSYGAAILCRALAIDAITRETFRIGTKSYILADPYIKLAALAEWTERYTDGISIIRGRIDLPESLIQTIEQYKGRALSELINNERLSESTILEVAIDQKLSGNNNKKEIEIKATSSIQRMGQAPKGITQENPEECWLLKARG